MKHKLVKDFYIPGEKHVCRFCNTPLAKKVDGRLVPLGNKAHTQVVLNSGTIHRFNGCSDCINRIDFKRYKYLLQQVWEEDCDMWEKMEAQTGGDPEEAKKRKEVLKTDKVLKGFHYKETGDKPSPERGQILAKKFMEKENNNGK